MSLFQTDHSNLQTQGFSEETIAALNLETDEEVFLALLEILRGQESVSSPPNPSDRVKTLIECEDCNHWASVEVGETRCPSCEMIRRLKQDFERFKQDFERRKEKLRDEHPVPNRGSSQATHTKPRL